MKELRYRNDWIFWADEEKTRAFYEKNESAVPPKLREREPEVAAFLEQMGVDTRKPLNPKCVILTVLRNICGKCRSGMRIFCC